MVSLISPWTCEALGVGQRLWSHVDLDLKLNTTLMSMVWNRDEEFNCSHP